MGNFLNQLLSQTQAGAAQAMRSSRGGSEKKQMDPYAKTQLDVIMKHYPNMGPKEKENALKRVSNLGFTELAQMEQENLGIISPREKQMDTQSQVITNILQGLLPSGGGSNAQAQSAPPAPTPTTPPLPTPQAQPPPTQLSPNTIIQNQTPPPTQNDPAPEMSPPKKEGDFIVREITLNADRPPTLRIAKRTLDDLKLETFNNLEAKDKEQAALLLTLGGNTFKTFTEIKTGETKMTAFDAMGKEVGTHTLGKTQLTPDEQVAQEGQKKAAQQAEVISTKEREIKLMQRMYSGLKETEAADIIMGVKKIVQSPVTKEFFTVNTITNEHKPLMAQAGTEESDQISKPTMNIWDLSDLATGPKSAGYQALSTFTGMVGLPVAEATIQARQFVSAAQNNLIRALSINPRFPIGEIERIKKEINLEPAVFDNPKMMRNRIIAIDSFLRQEVANKHREAKDISMPVAARQDALQGANEIENFLIKLGTPQRVNSIDEARALKPGTPFIDPKGKIRMR